MSKPITPSEVGRAKTQRIPAQVFDAFNDCISKSWDGRSASFTQNVVVEAILERMPDMTRSQLYEQRWLDVEDSYRAAGWEVEYDRPGYCETYAATFTFKRRKR